MGDENNLSYKIFNDESIIRFTKSSIYNDIIEFITNLNKSVIGVEMKPLEDFKLCNENDMINDNFLLLSKNVYNIFQLIKNMNKCIDSCPPINQSSRFGNKGFQYFCDAYYKEIDEYLPHALSESNIPNISEHTYQISYYLKNSIGNKKRIDYGTGHELNFLLFLFCLNKLNFFIPSDYKHLVLVIYRQYLEGVRRVQIIYTVEPAGSRGAWGLDDFQFLVFLFGAAQLSYNRKIKTDDIEKKELLELWAPKYLYFDALKYISMIKHAPFHESSRMLYDISGVETWEKICNGLLKMYQAEIIQKRQILQHILFGNLIDF
ncbi:serine/threonine protein phosphatase 2A activator [Plasmodium gaboni]|uniref:Serine/threonine-protein phosphatase 2A activator n=1 Tax=Plasmodium gaboni TaxID=647221 RepID=A0A151LAI3_9APIC|nr:serine/threonine protein phosphatase 2A activator [Plasmodium gaboni]KYN95897.1 serine/threonine protein phosphatase 2A activator [Plasmodium gaboni]SOV19038.1 serine/threonine protein phosphatase 2A activator [Plasmodium gaboni]SOV25024.1 serine/threonine protein phosphatase 2A activator [Plasmodium sp. DRC-Itaito]